MFSALTVCMQMRVSIDAAFRLSTIISQWKIKRIIGMTISSLEQQDEARTRDGKRERYSAKNTQKDLDTAIE